MEAIEWLIRFHRFCVERLNPLNYYSVYSGNLSLPNGRLFREFDILLRPLFPNKVCGCDISLGITNLFAHVSHLHFFTRRVWKLINILGIYLHINKQGCADSE